VRAPRGLGDRGRGLWRSVIGGLPDGWELDERESALLELAAHQQDDLVRLEASIERLGAFVPGSAGQPVMNPALAEARQARLAIGRILGQIDLPDEEEKPRSQAGQRGQRAARARWDRQTRLQRLREAASGDGAA
jgi:hypothetical protein